MSYYSSLILASSPLVYWRLNDTNTTARNLGSSGAPENGAYGGTYTQGQSSLISGDATAASTHFNNGHVIGTAVSTPSAYTVEWWWNVDTNQNYNAGVTAEGSSAGWDNYGEADGSFQWIHGSNVVAITLPAGTVTPGTTQYMVATWDGTTVKVYVNATLVGSVGSVPPLTNGTNLEVASRSTGGTAAQGFFQEVAVYATALSQVVITAHYNAGTNPPPPPIRGGGFSSWWAMGDD